MLKFSILVCERPFFIRVELFVMLTMYVKTEYKANETKRIRYGQLYRFLVADLALIHYWIE